MASPKFSIQKEDLYHTGSTMNINSRVASINQHNEVQIRLTEVNLLDDPGDGHSKEDV